ncbi:MAG: helix-turn-helix domain-containing protein [Pseudomonadota bacterium]
MEVDISNRLSILGHPNRLALFRLLMRRHPDRVPATELAQALGLKPNTLSNYVSALMQAGLVTQQRFGTSLRYAIDIETVRETFDYLLGDCCRGRPDICAPLSLCSSQDRSKPAGDPYTVLFLCTGNSARSIFAEAILQTAGQGRFAVFSAGTKPRAALNPFALRVLHHRGHDTSLLHSKNVEVFRGEDAPDFDFVFTVCDQAANEDCPVWTGHPISAHWGVPDPALVTGTDAEKSRVFEQTYAALKSRIEAFAALPLDTFNGLDAQHAVDRIAHTHVGPSL